MAEHPVEPEGDNSPTIASLKSIQIQFYLNLALVQVKAENYGDAIKTATRVLELSSLTDADKAKAYYRRGMAYGKTREEDLAVTDLKSASELNPGDKAIERELRETRERVKSRKDKERKAFAKMFS